MSAAIRESSGSAGVVSFVKHQAKPYPAVDPLQADLSGTTVVITGASKGCGREAAIAFAQSGASNIVVTARSDLSGVVADIKKAAHEAGRKAEPNVLDGSGVDITSAKDVEGLAKRVADKFNAVDLLINNAGFLSTWAPLAETDPDEWWTNWEVNIKGAYLLTRYFIPLVLKSHLKTVLNITSIGAVNLGAGASGYQTTKFALCRLTEHIAADYADQGLICVAAHPGSYPTNMGKRLPLHLHEYLTDDVVVAGQWMAWFARERREWLQARYVSAVWDVTELEARKDEIVEGNKLKFRMVI